ncbi:SusC/RagA family TonB-linked outer membrane protein [Sphingobacterium composti Ten et al. 2007 non Yoo et al. 2007]|uniref:SusC/RagA family TonB-linked outer membrane protein n=1 Tax=Sphingobacterium composti TaxID=363260 RepID=UPI0013582AFA|nr:SusC/RagA family TonB-linked outer membrane protein [Sphingobacterium composti Ten et al. 2007 non Yoo et al. 2007]
MKVVLLILITSLQLVAAKTSAQRISLQARNEKLDEVFKSITTQSNFKFLYNDEVITKHPRVSLEVKNEPLDAVLSKLLPKGLFEYKIVSNTILVNVVSKAANETTIVQTKASGTVVDENGNPISNASVILVGSSTVVVSDKDGKFQIQANVGNTLEARYVGYQSARVTVSSLNNIRIVLRSDASTNIEEVNVVATGYQNIDRKLFTGATTKVNAKDAERNGVPDISRMLEGQAAGVSVQNVSGTFGAAPKIRVRGATSLSGDNKPLWVVDGIILEDVVNISNEALSTGDASTLIGSSVAGLNPDDIESFTILKDAAATAMYGARAMNGVIVVNTKKGRNTNGKPIVSYTSNFTTYIKPTYNEFDIMNSAEQISVLLEMENKGYYSHSNVANAKDGGIFFKMYNQMYDYDPNSDSFTLKNTKQERLNFLSRYAKANTDWFDVLFKNSLLQEHSASVTTGGERSQSYFSTSFLNDSGMTLGDNVKRYTMNTRNNFKLSDKFSVEFLVNGSIRDQQTPGTLTRQSDPVYGKYSRDFDINPYSYALNTSRLVTPYDENGNLEFFTRNYAPFNILNELENNFLKLNMLDLKAQGGIKYKFLPYLTYSADGSYRYAKSERQHHVQEYSNMAQAYRANANPTVNNGNFFLYDDPDFPNEPSIVVLPEGGFYNTTLNNIKNYYFRHNLEFDHTYNEDHRLNVFGSMELRYTDRQYTDYDGVGYQYDNGGLVNSNYKFFKRASEAGNPYFGMGYSKDRFAAYAIRAAYAFKNKYSVNSTFRYDGSNLMGKSRTARWLPTWNVSGAWDIDQEKFFEPIRLILSGARIRSTYGLTASMGSANNSAAVFYSTIARRPYDNEKESLIYNASLENSGLTWEKLYEFNIGTDLSFFNKIDVTADYYTRNIFDLIGTIRTSGIGGEYQKIANYGTMKAHGFELTVAGNPISRQDGFKWRTQFNFGINKNEVTRLDVNQNIWTLVRAEGAPLQGNAQRGLYSLQFDGLNPQYGYPTYIGTFGERNETDIWLQDTDIDYLKYHGPTDPTFTGGFYNQFSYKNFSLSALFTFAKGNYVRLQPTISDSYDDMTAMSRDIVNRWITPGDEAITNIPAILDRFDSENRIVSSTGKVMSPRYPYNAYNYSTERIAKGDFIRFKNISLRYQLPNSFVERFKVANAQLAFVGNNILLLYSDKKLNGADPEFFNNGGVAMPIPKQYTLSLKVGF